MWGWLASFLSGPLLGKLVDAYKLKLDAGNTSEKIAADLAGRELAVQQAEMAAQAQIRIAEIGKWYEPDHVIGYVIALFLAKVYLWDAALHLGSSDAVKGDAGSVLITVVMFYFGKRGIENVVRIIKR